MASNNRKKRSAKAAESVGSDAAAVQTSDVDAEITPAEDAGQLLGKRCPLSETDQEYFYNLLLERRRELLGDVGYMRDEALHHSREDSAGSLSNMPIHMADVGTDNYEQEFVLGLMQSERKMLREIDWALSKLKMGIYGICEGTGDPIARPRLEAKPEARYSVEFARMIEQGQAQPKPIEVVLEEMGVTRNNDGDE